MTTREELRSRLQTNNHEVGRALITLLSRQTATEQAAGETIENNGRGFNGRDAEFLTSLAQWYRSRGYLSPKQLACARKKLVKYENQLLDAWGEAEPKVKRVKKSEPVTEGPRDGEDDEAYMNRLYAEFERGQDLSVAQQKALRDAASELGIDLSEVRS